MTGGDIVYDDPRFANLDKYEFADICHDVLAEIFPDDAKAVVRKTLGSGIDGILLALDILAKTDEQKNAIRRALDEIAKNI